MRALLLLLAVLLVIYAGPFAFMALSPFLVGALIAAALQRPIGFFEKRFRVGRFPAALLCVVGLYVLLFGLLYWLGATVSAELVRAAVNYKPLLESLLSILRGLSEWVLKVVADADPYVQNTLQSAITSVGAWLTELISKGAAGVVNFTVGFASAAPMVLIYINFLLFGTYFIAKDYPRLRVRAAGVCGTKLKLALSIFRKGFFGYIKVQGIFALMVLIISGAVLSALKIDYAVLLALFLALLEFLPLFGNGTLLIPWGIACLILGKSPLGWFLLGLHAVQLGIRRMAEPKLMSAHMGISPLLSLVGMYAGMRLYGVAGLILGPIVALVLTNLYKAGVFQGFTDDCAALMAGIREWLGK